MTGAALPRLADRPRGYMSSVEGPPAGATHLWGSPAFGSCGRSTGFVDPRPSVEIPAAPAREARCRILVRDIATASSLGTTDALPRNFVFFGGNGLVFSVDRLFHRRGLKFNELSGDVLPTDMSFSLSLDARLCNYQVENPPQRLLRNNSILLPLKTYRNVPRLEHKEPNSSQTQQDTWSDTNTQHLLE